MSNSPHNFWRDKEKTNEPTASFGKKTGTSALDEMKSKPMATYPPPPKLRSSTISGPSSPPPERTVQSLKDADRKELIRLKALEQQKKLEEEEKRLAEEEMLLKEQEKRLEEERKRRLEQKRLGAMSPPPITNTTPTSTAPKVETPVASPIKPIATTPVKPTVPDTKISAPTTPTPNLSEREQTLLKQYSTLKTDYDRVMKQNIELIAKLEQEMVKSKRLEETIKNLNAEVSSLRSSSLSTNMSSFSEKDAPVPEKKVMMKLPKLFASKLKEDESPVKKRSSTGSENMAQSPGSTLKGHVPAGIEDFGSPRKEEVDKKVSLESITKADMIKEMIGNKYSSFAVLRKNQIEQLETRRAVRNRSNTLDNQVVSVLRTDQDGTMETKKETLNAFLTSRQTKDKLAQQGILSNITFGVPLEALPIDVETGIPQFLIKTINFLESKAITQLNLFSETVDPLELQSAKQLSQGGEFQFETFATNHLVASLLAEFFRDLPDPIFPYSMHKLFVSWMDIDDYQTKISALKSLVRSIPALHRQVLTFLVGFFYRYVTGLRPHMTSLVNVIAGLFGPTLLRQVVTKNEDYLKTLEKLLKETGSDELHAGEISLRYMIQEYPRVFGDELDVSFIRKDGNEIVSIAKVEKLIQLLLDNFYTEINYNDIFLLTHKYFIPSLDLLKIIEKEYNMECGANWKKTRRTKITRVLKTWVGLYYGAVKNDKAFVEYFRNFSTQLFAQTNKKEKVFEKFLALCDGTEKIHTMEPPGEPIELDILEVDPYQIAEQYCFCDQELLRLIQPHEFLNKSFLESSKAPAFNNMVDSWNKRSHWIVTEILKRDKLPKRASTIVHFIKVAEYCKQMNNFHCSYAILCALSHVAVSRLEKTWEKVPKKMKSILDNLLNLFEMTFNYKKYRTALQTASVPIIPYLGLFPKDITSLEEMPTKLDNGSINFNKLRDLHSIINQISRFTSARYKIEKNIDIYNYLVNIKPYSEKRLLDLSESYEPRRKKSEAEPPTLGRTYKQMTADEIQEFKRLAVEKYEAEQQKLKNLMQHQMQSSQSLEDDDDESFNLNLSRLPKIIENSSESNF